jgi:hypothetical protein
VLSLTYVSSASELLGPDDLLGLLAQSRESNQRRGITGMLLYRDGNILQCLEGPEPEVRSAYDAISRDPRHRGVLTLVEEEVAERSFTDWSMGFKDLSATEVGGLEGFNDFLRSGELDYLGDKAEPVFHLIKVFRDSR